MTPTQLIKKDVIEQMIAEENYTHDGEITLENVDSIFEDLDDRGIAQDFLYEYRQGQVETGLSADYSRNYESEAVAAKMSNGVWVGWTYWTGGGKHGQPESIDWMSDAYFVDCKEEEKMVIVQTFTKPEPSL